jgi:hypothetical protein
LRWWMTRASCEIFLLMRDCVAEEHEGTEGGEQTRVGMRCQRGHE